MIAEDGRCEGRDPFGKCGSGQRVSEWHSIVGEIPLRIPAARDVRCMVRANTDLCIRQSSV